MDLKQTLADALSENSGAFHGTEHKHDRRNLK